MNEVLIGEKFLDKLYKDLYESKEFERYRNSNGNHVQAIKDYMDRLERIHNKTSIEGKKNALKYYYHKRYITNYDQLFNNKDKKEIISAQRKSLDSWINYLSDKTAAYPMWAKYWAFQGMLKLGTYDAGHETYQRRTVSTTAPFIDCNPEIIANCINAMTKYIMSTQVPSEDKIEDALKTGSFKKLYEYYEKKYKLVSREKPDKKEGTWIKYHMGSRKDAKRLVKSLENKNTRWCTAQEDMAIGQVCGNSTYQGGDFYVYYTVDKNNKYTIPRIAIRMDGHDSIGEIRGVDDCQNLEIDMIPVLESKLNSKEFKAVKFVDDNLEIVNGLRKLTSIYKKTVQGKELTEEEIDSLYTKKYGFGYQNDSMVDKIKKLRDWEKDFYLTDDIDAKGEISFFYIEENKKTITNKEIAMFYLEKNVPYYIEAIFSSFSKELQNDKELILKIMESSDIYNLLSEELKKDNQVKAESVKFHGEMLFELPKEYQMDKDLVVQAAENKASIIPKLDPKFQADEDIIRIILNEDIYKIGSLTKKLPKYADRIKAVALSIFKSQYIRLMRLPEKYCSDPDFIRAAIENEGYSALYFVPLKKLPIVKEISIDALAEFIEKTTYNPDIGKLFSNDKEVMLKAYEIGSRYEYNTFIFRKVASEELKHDKDFLLKALKININTYNYIPNEYKYDLDILVMFLKNIPKDNYKKGYDFLFGKKVVDDSLLLAVAKKVPKIIPYLPDRLKIQFTNGKFKGMPTIEEKKPINKFKEMPNENKIEEKPAIIEESGEEMTL